MTAALRERGHAMTGSRDFFIKFWGVRGSIACPGPRTVRYGGNTSCIEVQCDETRVIFDGGTGLRDLGNAACRRDRDRRGPCRTPSAGTNQNGREERSTFRSPSRAVAHGWVIF